MLSLEAILRHREWNFCELELQVCTICCWIWSKCLTSLCVQSELGSRHRRIQAAMVFSLKKVRYLSPWKRKSVSEFAHKVPITSMNHRGRDMRERWNRSSNYSKICKLSCFCFEELFKVHPPFFKDHPLHFLHIDFWTWIVQTWCTSGQQDTALAAPRWWRFCCHNHTAQ